MDKEGIGTGKSVTFINIYSTLGLHHMTVCKPSTSTELVYAGSLLRACSQYKNMYSSAIKFHWLILIQY